MSMPFGGAGYELYRFQEGVFTQIDVSGITDGTEFDVSVDENKKNGEAHGKRFRKDGRAFRLGIIRL